MCYIKPSKNFQHGLLYTSCKITKQNSHRLAKLPNMLNSSLSKDMVNALDVFWSILFLWLQLSQCLFDITRWNIACYTSVYGMRCLWRPINRYSFFLNDHQRREEFSWVVVRCSANKWVKTKGFPRKVKFRLHCEFCLVSFLLDIAIPWALAFTEALICWQSLTEWLFRERPTSVFCKALSKMHWSTGSI